MTAHGFESIKNSRLFSFSFERKRKGDRNRYIVLLACLVYLLILLLSKIRYYCFGMDHFPRYFDPYQAYLLIRNGFTYKIRMIFRRKILEIIFIRYIHTYIYVTNIHEYIVEGTRKRLNIVMKGSKWHGIHFV